MTISAGVALGCSCLVAASPCVGSAQVERWTLERTVTIGDHGDPELGLTRVGDVIVVGERLFVAQRREHLLRIFSLAGDFLGFLGGQGEGPGEFSEVNWIGVRDGLVWVSDRLTGRVQYFDPEGRYASSIRIRGHPTLPMGWIRVRAVLEDGSMLVTNPLDIVELAAAPDRPEHVIRFDAGGSLRDTVSVLVGRAGALELGRTSRGGVTFTVLPESYRSLFAPSADGSGFVVVHREAATRAEPHTFRVIRFDARADTAWVRDIPYVPIPVSSKWRSRHLEKERRDLSAPAMRVLERAYRKLKFFPPVRVVRAGADGTTWLLVRTGVDSFEWEVLDLSGNSLARIEPPPHGSMRWAGTDALWFVEEDELDVPYLVQYAIRRP
ncbi:MAG: hypothetical protein J4F34_01095 [Gemmatimonadetes bacterium]|nr:hypothetical protein [Gemmatimonadota bacterium]